LQENFIMRKKVLFFVFLSLFYFSVHAQTSGELTIQANASIDKVVAQKIAYNKSLKTIRGYKIQLYYGSEQGAYGIKDKFNKLYPEIPAKLTFNTPDWKIQAGNYYTKLQADHDIVQFKIDFPGAIVIATDIDIAEN